MDIILQIVSFYNYYRHIGGDLSAAGNQVSLLYHRIAAAAVVVVVVIVLCLMSLLLSHVYLHEDKSSADQ